MTRSTPDSNGLPTQISVREIRADALHRVLLRRRVARVENVIGLSELWTWPKIQVELALADLVHDGRLAEDAHGRLIVRRRAS